MALDVVNFAVTIELSCRQFYIDAADTRHKAHNRHDRSSRLRQSPVSLTHHYL